MRVVRQVGVGGMAQVDEPAHELEVDVLGADDLLRRRGPVGGVPFSEVVAVLVMFLGVATVSLMTALITSAVITETQKRIAETHGDPELRP